MKDPNKALADILNLIYEDVAQISANFQNKQLDPQSAQTLCRYASTLSDIKNAKAKDSANEKKEASRLSTDQLIEMYKNTKDE